MGIAKDESALRESWPHSLWCEIKIELILVNLANPTLEEEDFDCDQEKGSGKGRERD